MDETIEMIIKDAEKRAEGFGSLDRSWIYTEVADRLFQMADAERLSEYGM